MYSLNVYYFMLVLYTVLDFQMNIFKRSIICFEVTARLGNYQLWREKYGSKSTTCTMHYNHQEKGRLLLKNQNQFPRDKYIQGLSFNIW